MALNPNITEQNSHSINFVPLTSSCFVLGKLQTQMIWTFPPPIGVGKKFKWTPLVGWKMDYMPRNGGHIRPTQSCTGVVGSVGWLSPTGRLVTVDIDGRFGSTYGITWSISTVGSVTPSENYGRYRRSVRSIVSRNWSISTISVGSYKKKIGRRSISTVEVDIHSKQLKKSVDIEFAYPYFTMSTDENNCLSTTSSAFH